MALAFLDIGFGELVVVAFVALLLFGGRLPEVMRTLGATYRNFRRGVEGLTRETTKVFDVRPPQPQPPYAPSPPAQGTAPWMPKSLPTDAPLPPGSPATSGPPARSDAGPVAPSGPVVAAVEPHARPRDDDPPPV